MNECYAKVKKNCFKYIKSQETNTNKFKNKDRMLKSYLIPLTIIFAFAGSFVFRHNPADLYFLLFFGIFGYILKKLQFDVTPLVMAFILAPSLEYAFGQTLSLGDDNVLMYLLSERPIAALIIVSTPVITWKLFQRSKKLRDVATSLTSSQVKSS